MEAMDREMKKRNDQKTTTNNKQTTKVGSVQWKN